MGKRIEIAETRHKTPKETLKNLFGVPKKIEYFTLRSKPHNTANTSATKRLMICLSFFLTRLLHQSTVHPNRHPANTTRLMSYCH